ncbi:MAG: PLP-dependent aspartate aminotransferase family protein [Planctomycetota bacterium]|nr:PLP-dependent aspartate aminotransferase family protein [Planctomycetota bacterium]
MSKHIDTLAVHAGREDFRELGVHAPPLDLSSTYPVKDLDSGRQSIDGLAAGDATAESPIYSRLHNTSVYRYECAFAQLENCDTSVAFGSGMAAIHAVFMSLKIRAMQDGVDRNHIIGIRPIYGCTDHLLCSGLLGFDIEWVDEKDVASAIRPTTALVVIESPANPTLDLVDIKDIVRQAGDVPVMVDNTFATPVLQTPLELGATFSVHSATKYLGGHGDIVAGMVATDNSWAAHLRQIRILTGGIMHPMAALMLMRSLPTLPLRVERAQENAIHIAEQLSQHPAVKKVLFPGLDECDPRGLVGTQMKGPGSVIGVDLNGGYAAAANAMKSSKLFTPAVSLGSTDSLIEHPAGLTHRIVSDEGRQQSGITEGLLRLSIGVENKDDIWADLKQALS